MITLRQNPNEPTLYIGSERGGGKLPAFAQEASPRLISATPADNSGAVSTSPTIRLTFDTPVTLGSGSFFISDGATQSYIDPGTGMPSVRIVGATHTLQVPASSAAVGGGGYYVEFNPPATLKGGVNYFVFFKPGPILGAGNGLPNAGLLDSTQLNFVTDTDTTAPTALSAKADTTPGAYNAGDIITITVSFSEHVTVTGNPRLELNVGSGKYATLSGPPNGSALTFSYTVQAGDTAPELAFNDLNDLATGIVDGNGNPLTLGNIAFSQLDASNSTGAGSDIVIDTTAPTAGAWNVTAGATDVPHGSTLSLSFSEAITPTDANSRVFVSVNGAAAASLAFTDPSISWSGNTLFLQGLAANTSYEVTLSPGALSDLAGNPIAGSPQIAFATSATDPSLDTIAPVVLDVSATSGAAAIEYNVGNTITLQVTMSEAVNVTGVPVLRLQLANGTADASYVSKDGKVLTFSYVVAAGDNVASLAYAGTSALLLSGGAAITDIKGNPAVLTLPAPGTAHSLDVNTDIEIDTVPFITGTAPTSGSGAVALNNNLLITFSEAMTQAGASSSFRLYRDDGGVTTELPVTATVTGTVVTLDPVADFQLNKNYFVQIDAGALVDSDGNAFAGITGNTGYTFNTTVDGVAPTATAAKTTNAAGTYKAGDTITIEVSFSETVTVTGTPKLELSLGSGKFATLTGPTTGATLSFAYVVQPGDTAAELGFLDTADLASGIEDLGGNALDLAHIAFSSLDAASGAGYGSDIAIDTTAPTALGWNVTTGATDVAHTGPLVLTLSENIAITDANAKLSVQVNGGAATEIALSDPSVTVTGTTLSWAGLAQNTAYSVTLVSGSLKDAGGNLLAAAPATHFATAAVPTSGDTMAPVVLNVSASSGSAFTEYNLGQTITIQVTMSETVVVSGTPKLQLQLDGKVVEALYSSMSGKVLNFTYTVAAGDNTSSLSYVDSTPFVFDGGDFIRDAKGNDMYPIIAVPTAPGSLDINTDIKIDTNPVATGFAPAKGAAGVAVGSNIVVTFSEAVTLAGAASNLRLYRDDGGLGTQIPAVATVSGNTVTFNPDADLATNQSYYVEIDNVALADADGNAFAGLTGTTAYAFNTNVDATPPTATSAKTTNLAGAYNVGDTIYIEVSFNETVTVTGAPKLELALGANKFATHFGATSGTSLTFSYVVQEGDSSALLAFTDTGDLAGGIADLNGNALDLAHIAFSTLGSSDGGGYGSAISIDGVLPAVTSWSANAGETDFPHGSPLVINFSEVPISSGVSSGLQVSVNGGGPTTVLFTDTNITFSGSSILLHNLTPNATYTVTVPAGAVRDGAGNALNAAASISFATDEGTGTDTIAPVVLDITSDKGAAPVTLEDGEAVRFIVTMSEHMIYTGDVMLNLQIGADVVPVYLSGNSGNELYFDWNVEQGLNGADIEAVSITMNDAYLRDENNNNAVLTLPGAGNPGSLGYNSAITIDTAPIVTSANPEDGEGYLPVGIDLTFTFNEAVFFGSGGAAAIKLYKDGGPPTLIPTTVTINGNVVTVNPNANLDANAYYFVAMEATALVDAGGLPYGGTGAEQEYNFDTIVDTNAPTAYEAHTTSSAGVYGVGQAITIVVSFDEPVIASGNPTLTLNASGSSVAILDGSNSGTQLEFLYTIQAGDNAAELDFSGLASLASGITDMAGNPLDLAHISFSALDASGSAGYGSDIVIDTTAPVATGFSPADDANFFPVGGTMTITFSENVYMNGTAANFRLYRDDGGVAVQLGVTAFASGNTLTLDPDVNLDNGASYYIVIDSGAVVDYAGNGYAGIVGSTGYNFTAGIAA